MRLKLKKYSDIIKDPNFEFLKDDGYSIFINNILKFFEDNKNDIKKVKKYDGDFLEVFVDKLGSFFIHKDWVDYEYNLCYNDIINLFERPL